MIGGLVGRRDGASASGGPALPDSRDLGRWSRPELRGRAVGLAVLAGFALCWTNWGLSEQVRGVVHYPISAAAALLSALLIGGAGLVFRRTAALPPGLDLADGADAGRRFGIVVAGEFAGLGGLTGVLGGTGHQQLIPAAVCVGVGVHFYPLGRLFHVGLYQKTSAALCLLGLATFVFTPLTRHDVLWTALPGLGAAFVLYLTSGLLLRECLARSALA